MITRSFRALYIAIGVLYLAMGYLLEPERPEYAVVEPVAVLFGCGGGGDAVQITNPSSGATIKIDQVYVEVEVLKSAAIPPFQVWISHGSNRTPVPASQFVHSRNAQNSNFDFQHAIVPLPVGYAGGSLTLELYQVDPNNPQTTYDKTITFSSASDSRTHAGVDNFAKFCKMTVFERPSDRVLILLSSRNLAGTQAVISVPKQRSDVTDGPPNLWTARTMFDVAVLVADAVRATSSIAMRPSWNR